MLRRQRVWIIQSNMKASPPGTSYRFLKDQHRPNEMIGWAVDSTRASFWHTKAEAESVAMQVAAKFPDLIGRLMVTHRIRRTQW